MKLSILLILLIPAMAAAQSPEINIIPKPFFVKVGNGSFKLSRKTKIIATNESGRTLGKILNAYLSSFHGFQLGFARNENVRTAIEFDVVEGSAPRDHGRYTIKIDKYRLSIAGGDAAGAFYTLQSMFQLIPPRSTKEIIIPALEIDDVPNYQYRGMHLDVGRHFMPVEFVKKYIDLMSEYKFNYFHWHLTEDQGWRIEIKKYPRLTEIGSKHTETQVGFYSTTFKGDGVPHEGFYTQEQIRDIVAYAKARYVTVIPEIEMPGHSSAALAAYPELSCRPDQKYNVQMTWGTFPDVYCPTERTFKFLEDVISEVVALFPDSPYIHIGGDEVLKDMWKDSPEVKALMEREHLKDLNEVQSYFVHRMERFINSKGKRIIGWEEILDGGLTPSSVVMSWQGVKSGIAAARAHHDVIMTPTDYTYFDYRQGDAAKEPLGQPYYLPLEKVYSFDPIPKELTPDEAKYIIGGQGNVWTEYMQTPDKVEYMAFPRALALSEALWSRPENKDYADFQRRLAAQLPRLDKQHVNYRPLTKVGGN